MKDLYIFNWDSNAKVGGTNTFDRYLSKLFMPLTDVYGCYSRTMKYGKTTYTKDINYFPFFTKNYRSLKKVKGQVAVFNTFFQLWFVPKKFLKNNRIIVQQHFSSTRLKTVLGRWWKKPFAWMRFQHIDDLVLYDKSEYKKLKKIIPNVKIWEQPLFSERKTVKPVKKKDKYVYIGRIKHFQKKIFRMAKVFEKNGIDIDVYGNGSRSKKFKRITKKMKHVNYFGPLKHSDVAKKYNEYKANVLASDYEGYGYSVVDAASVNVPSLITNSFDLADKLFKNGDLGKVFDNIYDMVEWMKTNELKNTNAIKVYEQLWTPEAFEKNWLKIFKG